MGRWALATVSFFAAAAASAVVLAVVFGVLRLWLEGDGSPALLFAESERGLFGPSSPADILLVALSLGTGLVGSWIVLSRRA